MFTSHRITVSSLFTGAEGIKTEAEAKIFGGQATIVSPPVLIVMLLALT